MKSEQISTSGFPIVSVRPDLLEVATKSTPVTTVPDVNVPHLRISPS